MTNEFLTRSETQIIEGRYRLGAVAGRSAAGAVYETEFGEDARPAAIRICEGETADAEKLMARWRDAMELAHPNLLPLYAIGSSKLNDAPIVYAVMERADESLAGVLAERTLSETETREMLTPLLAGLKYLHKKGYAHGSVKPSNILAVGDLLKLSSDSAVRFEDGGSAAEDMRALGVVIVQALTQKPPKIDVYSGSCVLGEASETFTDIVGHCLDANPETRWSVDQVETRLNPPPPVAAAPVRLPPDPPVREMRPAAEERGESVRSGGTPKWIYGALAALVAVVLLGAVLRKKDTVPTAVAPVPVVSETVPEAAAPIPAPAPARAEKSSAPAAKPKPTGEAAPAVARGRGRRGEGWSVIAAAYGSRGPAEKRKQQMAAKWPKFNVSVFEQRAEKTYYLVVLGQNLSEDEADSLRKRAVGAGLPRDTYIKKLP